SALSFFGPHHGSTTAEFTPLLVRVVYPGHAGRADRLRPGSERSNVLGRADGGRLFGGVWRWRVSVAADHPSGRSHSALEPLGMGLGRGGVHRLAGGADLGVVVFWVGGRDGGQDYQGGESCPDIPLFATVVRAREGMP